MKRFRFALHPVAVLRAHAELRARENLATALQDLASAEMHLAGWQKRLADVEARLAAHRVGRFNGAAVASQLHAYRADCVSREEAAAALREARAALQVRRDEYMEASRSMKIIEKAEAHARQAHIAGTARAEQAEIDEFAVRKFAQSPARQ